MAQKFANAARAVLAAGIASGDTTVTIVSGGSLFPEIASPDFARAVLQDANGIEIVLITAHTASADSFTITRAQEGTTARSFAAGSVFGIRVTAADMDEALDAVNLATEVTGVLPITNGGTGQTTRQAALDALAGAVTAGQYLRGDGTDVVMSAIQAADVPTLNQNTTGTASNVTGTVAVANGGTGLTSFTANGVVYASSTSALTTGSALTFDGSQLSVNGGAGGIPLSLDANTGGNTNLFFSEGGVAKWYLRNITGNGGFSFYDVNAGSESIRLTATGLGIGTSSPAAKLDVAGDYKEGVVTANTGTAYTISLASGTVQILTLTGNCTFTFPTATAGKSFTLLLRQDGTGSRTVTWPAAVKWPGGTAPTITSTASRQDKYIFTADSSSWFGSNAGQNYSF